jgi:sulfur carrier protein ThiS
MRLAKALRQADVVAVGGEVVDRSMYPSTRSELQDSLNVLQELLGFPDQVFCILV